MAIPRTNLSGILMDRSSSCIEPHRDDGVEPAWDDRSGLRDEPPNHVSEGGQKGTASESIAAYGWVALLIVASSVVNVMSARDVSGTAGLVRPLLFEATSAEIACVISRPTGTAGCAILIPRNVLPEASASRIELDGFQNIRFWGDESEEAIFRYEVLHIRRQKQRLIDISGGENACS